MLWQGYSPVEGRTECDWMWQSCDPSTFKFHSHLLISITASCGVVAPGSRTCPKVCGTGFHGIVSTHCGGGIRPCLIWWNLVNKMRVVTDPGMERLLNKDLQFDLQLMSIYSALGMFSYTNRNLKKNNYWYMTQPLWWYFCVTASNFMRSLSLLICLLFCFNMF